MSLSESSTNGILSEFLIEYYEYNQKHIKSLNIFFESEEYYEVCKVDDFTDIKPEILNFLKSLSPHTTVTLNRLFLENEDLDDDEPIELTIGSTLF